MKKDNNIIIRCTNTELVLPEGVSLALVDANGKILKQGKEVEADVFEAMKDEAVNCIMGRGIRLTKHDS
jgi:hypothetical protein